MIQQQVRQVRSQQNKQPVKEDHPCHSLLNDQIPTGNFQSLQSVINDQTSRELREPEPELKRKATLWDNLITHFNDLKTGSYEGRIRRKDKEELFKLAVQRIDPFARQALEELNTSLMLGSGTVQSTGLEYDPIDGPQQTWYLTWPEQTRRKLPPIIINAFYGYGFLHPHLRGASVGQWPLNVSTPEAAEAELTSLRAIAAAEIHNLIFKSDYRIIPATTRG